MTPGRLLLRNLRFHARSHGGVLLGAILATAIITGALAVGDSVRESLRRMALDRLGSVEYALFSATRFFRAELAEEIASDLQAPVAPVVVLRGTATGFAQNESGDAGQGELRAGNVRVLGVGDAFWKLGNTVAPKLIAPDGAEGIAINTRLARNLEIEVGDEVLLRVDKPSLLSRDAPLSTIEDATVTLRVPVTAVLTDAQFGRFSIEANQVPPFNAFLPVAVLQKLIGMEGRANALLMGTAAGKKLTTADATGALWKRWQLTDAGLELKDVPDRAELELRTDRVFLDPAVGDAAVKALPGSRGILTYFVNELRVGSRSTPYSTVAALQGAPLPSGMRDNETVINRWLADDLGAKVGDKLTIRYWLVGPMRRLEEHQSQFTIRAILPMEGPARDPMLMPDIPGLSDKKDCREWEPGVPVDLDKIRDKDQAYWDAYRGTPKAFLTLNAGQRIWNNRFGNLTAVRYPSAEPAARAAVETCIRQTLSPASLGMFFLPVRENALAASAESLDFGQLFLGFSVFLIVAALLLTALLFAFGVEQRAEEVGTLLALGFPAKLVQRLLLLEGAVIALLASGAGVLVATLYTRLVLDGLSGVWSGAVAGTALSYHTAPATPLIGGLSGFLMALLSIFLVARRQARVPARELLNSGTESESRLLGKARSQERRRPDLFGLPFALILGVAALGMSIRASTLEGEGAVGFFFGAGSLLLIAGIVGCRVALASRVGSGASGLTIPGLALRNSTRRMARSLAAISLLACGSFMVIAVGANRHDPAHGGEKRSSGTGGFALYGESSLPVYQDLNTLEGREAFALDEASLSEATILAFRLREGDDASCLNLNRAQTPRLLGVAPAALAERGAFTFAQAETMGSSNPWSLLESVPTDEAIPVIGDMNTVVWSLGKKLGDTLPYTDDRGNTRYLRIVGVLASSILQGGLILSEENFIRLFPGRSGYQVFLVDTPPAQSDTVRRELTRGLEDTGLALTPTTERLAAFNSVENTYLSIFAVLGGLGLILGSVGLGVIVLRNTLERRAELALLRAVGWPDRALRWLVFSEHILLLLLGLLVGVFSALVAVLPALRSPGADVPYLTLALTLLGLLVSGFAWVSLATGAALRAPLLPALRNE